MNKSECAKCEGRFAYNETVITYHGKEYCKDCYRDVTEGEEQ